MPQPKASTGFRPPPAPPFLPRLPTPAPQWLRQVIAVLQSLAQVPSSWMEELGEGAGGMSNKDRETLNPPRRLEEGSAAAGLGGFRMGGRRAGLAGHNRREKAVFSPSWARGKGTGGCGPKVALTRSLARCQPPVGSRRRDPPGGSRGAAAHAHGPQDLGKRFPGQCWVSAHVDLQGHIPWAVPSPRPFTPLLTSARSEHSGSDSRR